MQKVNVVLTHTMADFDSLAAAVGLAKLWQEERPDDGAFQHLTSTAHGDDDVCDNGGGVLQNIYITKRGQSARCPTSSPNATTHRQGGIGKWG